MNPGDDGVAISRVVETAASWDGAPLPSYPRGAPRVTILRATVPPHTALAMHTHALVNAGEREHIETPADNRSYQQQDKTGNDSRNSSRRHNFWL